MNISLTPELDNFVQQKVQTGMYHSASEVIREGLRLLREQDEIRQARLGQLRRDIDLSIDQIARNEYSDYTTDSIKDLANEIKLKGRQNIAVRSGVVE